MKIYPHESFAPGGTFYGLDGADFVFASWSDVWKAVNTIGHPLSRDAEWILARRQSVSFPWQIRVSYDLSPPIVETILPRWLGNTLIFSWTVAFWTVAFWLVLV